MPVLGMKLFIDDDVKEFVKMTDERLKSPDWRLNGMVRGAARIYGDVVVVVADPQWPRAYLLGPFLLAVALLFWGVSWALLPGLLFSAAGYFWSRSFWASSFRRGLRRHTVREPRLLGLEETVRVVLSDSKKS